jgi:long-subunit acyl-CoA synthetase (AMP-forming)
MSYSPLAHGMDRGMIWQGIMNGGRIGFARSSSTVIDDAKVLEPVIFVAMPHVWNKMYTEYLGQLEKSTDGKNFNLNFFDLKIEN